LINFVRYDPNTGAILARYSVSEGQAKNYDHRVPIDDIDHPYEITHRVNMNYNSLEPKNEVKLSANKTSIQANGSDQAIITVGNLIFSGYVTVNFDKLAVTPADSTVTLTSDTQRDFVVRYVPDINQFSVDELTITAI